LRASPACGRRARFRRIRSERRLRTRGDCRKDNATSGLSGLRGDERRAAREAIAEVRERNSAVQRGKESISSPANRQLVEPGGAGNKRQRAKELAWWVEGHGWPSARRCPSSFAGSLTEPHLDRARIRTHTRSPVCTPGRPQIHSLPEA